MRTLVFALLTLAVAGPAFAQEEEAVEELVVQATRSGRRVQDEPIRVEVLDRDEIEEKILMRPGNIAMMLSETGGLRVQVTAPGLGAANVRVQGMRGRYTQLLADGLPLYGGQAIGLLQVAPTDLGQVEVIKGAASALYGPSALGGVINLVSRRPGVSPQGEVLANITSRGGQDVTAYGAAPLSSDWSGSVTLGAHRQARRDLDDDGWADMAAYDRVTLRPRLFWDGAGGARAYLTAGFMDETRRGGGATPDGRFPLSQDSRRFDAGITAELPAEDAGVWGLRASAMTQAHDHRFGALLEQDRHDTFFAEGSWSLRSDHTTWLVGVAIQADRYRSKTFPAFDYDFTNPGVFLQAEHDLRDDLTLAASGRLDRHSEYGARFSPRLSLLYRPRPWTFRASFGRGFYAPTPFVEEIEAVGLSRLEPLAGLKAEAATSGSLEGGYARGPWEASLILFGSDIRKAVRLEDAGPNSVRLVNARGDTRTRGAEALLRYRWRDITLTGSYVHTDSTEPDPAGAGRRAVPLTPHHTAGLVGMWEAPGKGRIGLEAYYTGGQSLDDNPYRTTSKPYFELGALAEVVVGRARLFVNLENILNVRQTRYDRLVRPSRARDGGWTVEAWAPTDGFVVNGGVRLQFGG